MAITPINISRTSFNLQTLSLIDSLRHNTLTLFLEQNRLASGNRLNAPSEDPVLASRALNLTQILDRQDQILLNIQHADAFLAATDNNMSDISDLMTEAKSIASEMVNSVVDPAERASEAEIISSIIDQLVIVGNQMYNGMQLFAGKDVTSPPFSREYGGVVSVAELAGATGQREVTVRRGLEWLAARGQLSLEEWLDGERVRLGAGGQEDSDALEPLQDAIAALLAEAAAYRAYFRRASLETIIRAG